MTGMGDAADGGRRQREAELRDREAEGYRQRYRREKGAWWDDLEIALLTGPIERSRAKTVLDAGAGVGRTTLALAEGDLAVDAFDISRASLGVLMREARMHGSRVRAIVCDLAEGVPVRTSTYDAAVSGQVIQHLPRRDDRLRAWREIARACRPGGLLSATVYHRRPWQESDGVWPDGPAFHRYEPADLAAELTAAGWMPVSIRAFYRLEWRILPAPVAATFERILAAAHLFDHRAVYLHVIAARAVS